MDSFNIVWCALWSDYFMAQHQLDTESMVFRVPTDLADDFLFFLTTMLSEKKEECFFKEEKTFVSVQLTPVEIEKVTDWILDFNFSTRKPSGLVMPDLYLGDEKIRRTTVNVYCHIIGQVIAYMLKNQNAGRDNIGKWAANNFVQFYAQAYNEAIRAKAGAE